MSSEVETSELEEESMGSDSSTVVYDHEAFETFKAKVLDLCQKVIAPSNGEITIQRMRGGGFNRIIGVVITRNGSPTTPEYILRIPRFEAAQFNRDLAPLQLLHQRLKLKIPNVVAFDTTSCNVVESPYMIQTRIPGSSLFPAYPNLPHEVKCAIAKELGDFISELHSIRSATAGRLTIMPSGGSLMVEPFNNTGVGAVEQYKNGPPTRTTSDTLLAILRHKKELAVADGPSQSFRASFFDSFIIIALEMSALGVLDENYYCLCHLDLEPRNILAILPSLDHPQAITGILDWDSAIFAPPFMSCSPPMWLWAWNDDGEEDERLAGNTPPSPELRELKQLFEDAPGPIYRRFAYGAQYRLARILLRFAIDGLQSNEDLVGAETLLSEWTELQGSLKLEKSGI